MVDVQDRLHGKHCSTILLSHKSSAASVFSLKKCSIADFRVGLNATAICRYSQLRLTNLLEALIHSLVSSITKMNGTKSKGRSPKVPKFNDEKTPLNGGINGKPKEYSNVNLQPGKKVELSENIFLFYPNLIGMYIG